MTATLILWSHALAGLLFGAVAFVEVRRPRGGWPRAAFVSALLLTTLWALAVSGIDARDVSARIAESARNIAWLAFMLALVRRDRVGNYALGSVYAVVMAIAGIAAVLSVAGVAHLDAEALAAITSARLVFRMMTAVSALVLVHHLYRAAPASHGGVRLVVLALAAMWSVDLVLFAVGYAQAAFPATLVAARGFAMVGIALLLMVAVHRSGDWTLSISRAVATRSLAAIALVVYAGLVVLATNLAEGHTAGYTRAVQTAIVIGAAAALLALVSTPWLRAWVKVKVAKHLFRHRYDYRAEWQRFTDTLGAPGDGAAPLGTRVVKALADLTESPGGLLLVPEGAGLGIGATWNWHGDLPPGNAPDEALATQVRTVARIIELDPVRAGTAPADEVANVPAWLHDGTAAWAIVPLLHGGSLAGAIVLARPPIDRALDWEDFDLLRVAGRQAASYLAEDRAHAALADARRFDEFNRRFAFIMHDIKNLVSQLTLVARNAERHAENPEFRADMVATLKDSADRMNALLARLSQHNGARGEPLQPIDVGALIDRIASARRAQHPVAARAAPATFARGHAARLEQVLGHLVQNAIEASGDDAPVLLSVESLPGQVAIDVIDKGCGMAPGFVRDQLFRPFVSSKPAGFGIGAFEALQLVQAMGGTLDVASREGEGSRFRILLPAASGNANALEIAA